MTEKKIRLIEPVIGDEELQMVKKVFESRWLTEGPMTKQFEEKIKGFTGAQYAVSTTNCTTALELGLRALQVGSGDEVIVPDFTYPATADVVKLVGAEPVLVDVNLLTYNIDVEQIKKAVSKKTKCIIPVSWGGNPLNFKALNEVKEKFNVSILEDAACSLGAEFDGEKTGVVADATCFSFHPRKIITTGEGGMVTTNRADIAEKIESFKRFGIKNTPSGIQFMDIGTNCKFNDILAAIGVKQMEKVNSIIEKRRELAKNYDSLFASMDFVNPPQEEKGGKHVYQSYAVYIETEGLRDKILQSLRKENIETQIGTYALHLQPAFKESKKVGRLKIAEKLYKNLLTLPMSHSMTFKDQEYIVKQIENICRRN